MATNPWMPGPRPGMGTLQPLPKALRHANFGARRLPEASLEVGHESDRRARRAPQIDRTRAPRRRAAEHDPDPGEPFNRAEKGKLGLKATDLDLEVVESIP